MRDGLASDFFLDGAERDPLRSVRRDMRPAAPTRFYTQVSLDERDGRFVLLLDGKTAKTPARGLLALPSRAAMEAVAAEWAEQGETIDPISMPVTRIVATALDGVAAQAEAVRADVVKFAGSDLVCYRAAAPAELAAEQAAAWDPVVDGAAEFGARLSIVEGVVFIAQPSAALAAVAAQVARFDDPVALAALHVVTTLTGSALIALGLARGRLTADEAWAKAHVDEDFQARAWGADDEALARRAARRREMDAAALLLGLTDAR